MKWVFNPFTGTFDAVDDVGSGGTVTSITVGTGLDATPDPITTTGQIDLAFQDLPVSPLGSSLDRIVYYDVTAAREETVTFTSLLSSIDALLFTSFIDSVRDLTGTGIVIRGNDDLAHLMDLESSTAALTWTDEDGDGVAETINMDGDLTAIAALSTTGFAARTAFNTWALRTLTAPAAGLTISNPAGVLGNPVFALADDLAALEGLSTAGLAVRTGVSTWATRTLVSASTGALTVADGDGVLANPTLTVDADLVEIAGVSNVRGDLLVTNSGPTWVRLGIAGTANRVLRSDGTDPSWAQLVLTTDVSGILPLANGGTGINASSVTDLFNQLDPLTTAGDLLTHNGTNSIRFGLGVANTVLGVNAGATAVEYKTFAEGVGTAVTLGSTVSYDLDIDDLVAETSSASGDLIAFLDVSVGTAPSAQRKMTRANFLGATLELLRSQALGAANTVLNVNSAGTALEFDFLVAANVGALTGSGNTFVFNNGPTFTTDIRTPIVYGGIGVAGALQLQSTTDTSRGVIYLVDRARHGKQIDLGWDGITFDNDNLFPTAAQSRDLALIALAEGTITLSGTQPGFRALACEGTVHLTESNGGAAGMGLLFLHALTYTNTDGLNPGPVFTLVDRPVVSVNTTAGARTMSTYFGLFSSPTFSRSAGANGFTLTELSHTSLLAEIGTGCTVTTRRGMRYVTYTGGGALTLQIGVDIEALSGATTSIGIRNASTEVHPETVGTMSAVGSTVPITARVIRLNNTSGVNPLILTSAPTLADGVNDQIIEIYNGSANAVRFSDQGTLAASNLRLSTATFDMGTRDSLILRYSTTVGDWIEIGRTNVI